MTNPGDLLIRNAKLIDDKQSNDILIRSGVIQEIGKDLSADDTKTIDAMGGLVTPPFVNPHFHLCKVWTLPMLGEEALLAYQGSGMSDASTAIDLAARVKELYEASWIIENARRAVAHAALYGNLHIRAFADVDTKAKLEGVKALIAVQEEFKGIVDIEIVAFPQDGIAREPGADVLMRQAMDLGANVVGGIPWIESGDEDTKSHIDFCFDLAEEFDADVSMLLDDVGSSDFHTLEMMARTAIQRGRQGRALAHHCRAMALYPDEDIPKLADLLKEADVAVVTNPHTGPLHARVKELRALGVPVCLGQDDISDAYYTFGRCNMLEVAFLASHLLLMTTKRELDVLWDMITSSGARAMNIPEYGIAVGHPANLLVLRQTDVTDALRYHATPHAVIRNGLTIDKSRMREIAGLYLDN
jgi:cytosine deaminase